MSAVAALAERTSMRDVATLDALYEEAARVGFTPDERMTQPCESKSIR